MSFKGYSTAYLVLCGVALLSMLSMSLLGTVIPLFAKELGASGVAIGLTVAGYWVSRILLEIPSGIISQRIGYFRSMTVGLGLNVLGSLFSAVARDPLQFTIARILMGIGAPLFFAVSTTFVLNLFDAEHRGRAMGIFQGIEFGGTIIGSAFSGYLASLFNFRTSFLVSAGLIAISIVPMYVFPHIKEASDGMTAGSTLSLSEIRKVISNRQLLIVSSAIFAEFVMSVGIIMTIFPIYAVESLGITLTDIGLIMGFRSVGFVISMFMMGNISDRIGRRPVMLFGLGATAFLVASMSFISSFWGLSIVIFFLGITTGAIWIVSPVLASEAVESDLRGAAIGTYRTFFDLGSILGPIIMSIIFESYGMVTCLNIASILLILNLVPSMKITRNSSNS
jgi:MFS family permease